MELGRIIASDSFRLERSLNAPLERVWSYIVDADKRSRWFCAGDNIANTGQSFTFAFGHHRITTEEPPERWARMDGSQPDMLMTGRVLVYEPPHKLAITWGGGEGPESEVLFELSSHGARTLLVITHTRIASRESLLDFAGGWTAHIETLSDVLEGRSTNRFWASVVEAHKAYEQHTI
jgi:uncharacterized protein YndB with AHSA1/START domain